MKGNKYQYLYIPAIPNHCWIFQRKKELTYIDHKHVLVHIFAVLHSARI